MSNLNKNTNLGYKTTKKQLIDALNRLDEFASFETADNDNGEAEQQSKDYTLLFNLISSLEVCEHPRCNRIAEISQENYCYKHN